MSNTITSTPILHQAPSISQLDERDVAADIRYLGYGRAKLSVLVDNVNYKDGERKSSKGLIKKRSVSSLRYEMYTRTPRPVSCTVVSGTEIESSGIVVSSANGIPVEAIITNTRNNTSARVEIISGTTLKGTSVGATTFSVLADDTLSIDATATNEASITSPVMNGTNDQNFNNLQLSRWSASISWLKMKIKQMATGKGGSVFADEKMYLLWESMEAMERTWILGNISGDSATKNTTTGVQTGFTGEFPTTRGLISLAANSINANGSGDISWMRQNLPLGMGDLVNDNDMYIGLCGSEYFGRVVEEQNSNVALDASGELAKFGIKATDIVTSGPTISLMKHRVFNLPGLKNKMLLFSPSNIGYVHMDGHDLGPNNKIQPNNAHYEQDEIYAYHGIETKDAGQTITLATNLF
jgi:hypothetical protein